MTPAFAQSLHGSFVLSRLCSLGQGAEIAGILIGAGRAVPYPAASSREQGRLEIHWDSPEFSLPGKPITTRCLQSQRRRSYQDQIQITISKV